MERRKEIMGTDIRPEVTTKNNYWISKHRYYELKHFCLQYIEWKAEYSELDGMEGGDMIRETKSTNISNPVERIIERRLYLSDRIDLIETAALEAGSELNTYVLKAVTEGLSYDILKARFNIPCCRNVYYDIYRRFFWLLDKARK